MKKKMEIVVHDYAELELNRLQNRKKFRFAPTYAAGNGYILELFGDFDNAKLFMGALEFEDCPIKQIKLSGRKDPEENQFSSTLKDISPAGGKNNKAEYKSLIKRAIKSLQKNRSITSLIIGGQFDGLFLENLSDLISERINEVMVVCGNIVPLIKTDVVDTLKILSTKKHITKLGIDLQVTSVHFDMDQEENIRNRHSEVLSKFPNLESFRMKIYEFIFSMRVVQVLARSNKKLLNLEISMRELHRPYSFPSFFAKFEDLIMANPNLEKITMDGLFSEVNRPQLQSFAERVAFCPNLTYLDLSNNYIPLGVLSDILTNAKNLKTLVGQNLVLHDNNDDDETAKFVEVLKHNNSLKTMDFNRTALSIFNGIADVLKNNSTLQRIRFKLASRVPNDYKIILDALKYNTSINSFTCKCLAFERPHVSEEIFNEVTAWEKQVILHNKNLREFNDYDAELRPNRELFLKQKIAICSFIKMFAKNTAGFTNYLPMEVWLRIAKFMNAPGLRKIDQLLLETLQSNERPARKV